MKYYQFMAKGYGLKSKKLSMMIADNRYEFDYFSTERINISGPIKIKVNYYDGTEQIEEDYPCAGNPQIVSEEFKNLVEELAPNAAQFFETENMTYKTKKKYYVMHVTKKIYCLDEIRSTFVRELGNSIVIGIIDEAKVGENNHLFRLGESTGKHYVSEKFYKEYKKRKLTGCHFCLRS